MVGRRTTTAAKTAPAKTSSAKGSAKKKVEPARRHAGKLSTGSGAPSNDPRALEKALGARVRQLRRQQDLSVADLAGAAGLSTGMLSKIENGQISASLTSIHSLALAQRPDLLAFRTG
jgi:ribosome-binding protein aMBF1 (putative translation factor)